MKNYSRVPSELKAEVRWVLYKLLEVTDKSGKKRMTKVPFQSESTVDVFGYRDRKKASSTDSKTWSSFAKAVTEAQHDNEIDGIGFVLGDGWLGIDVDKSGQGMPDLIKRFDGSAYLERSISGNGWHAILAHNGNLNRTDGKLTGRKGNVEIYKDGRYFTVSGDTVSVPDEPMSTYRNENDQKMLSLAANLWPVKSKVKSKPLTQNNSNGNPSDQDLVRIAISKQPKFERQYVHGEIVLNSHSEEDLSLLTSLAFWTGKDPERMKSIFRSSALYREEKGENYLNLSIDAAIERHGNDPCFGDGTQNQKKVKVKEQSDPVVTEKKQQPIIEKKGLELAINGRELVSAAGGCNYENVAKYLVEDLGMRFMCLEAEGERLRILDNGVYKKDYNRTIEKTVLELLDGHNVKPEWCEKVVKLIKFKHAYDNDFEFPGLHKDHINCLNGFVEIKTGKLISHDDFYKQNPDVRSLIQIPVNYDPKATCPEFTAFLDEKMDGCDDTVNLIFQIFGCCLFQYVPIPAFIEFHGETHTGKSTTFKVLYKFLGRGNYSTEPIHKLDDLKERFPVSSLYGKLANIDADSSPKPLAGDGVLKKLSAGDPINIEKKYGDARTEDLFATSLHSANYDVKTKDKSSGHLSRLLRIPFTVSHEGNRVIGIEEKYTTDGELSGILNKALEGMRLLLEKNEWILSTRVEEEKETFRIANDPVLTWCEEYLALGQVDKNGNPIRTTAQRILNAYNDNAKAKVGRNNFYASLKDWAGVDKFTKDPVIGNCIPGVTFADYDDQNDYGIGF